MSKNIEFTFFSRITELDKVTFTKHMAVMMKAGISISETLLTLIDQTSSAKFKKILRGVYASVRNGQQLSTALEKYPKVFSSIYIKLIKIGEESGNLESNLEYLADKLNKDYAFRKKTEGVMVYPVIVIALALSIAIGISYYVLPKLTELFTSLGVTLPLSTRILIASSNFIRQYNILIPLGLFGLFSVLNFILNTPAIKPIWHKFMLKIPYFGNFILKVQLTTLFRNLGIMLRSGLTINTALQVSYSTADNMVIKQYMLNLLNSVTQGRSLETELSNGRYSFIPTLAIKIISVGEKSGTLDEMFLYLGTFFDEEVDNLVKNLPTVLEPALLISIGLLVGFIASAIITPIYQLTGSITK